MSKKIKVGIIGPGHIAETTHIPYYKSYGDEINITSLCGRTLEKTSEVAGRFQIPGVYTNIDSFLKQEKPDIVSICTPNIFHKDAVLKCLEAGCHVLCEKPPATNFDDAHDMTVKAEACGKLLAYNFQYRQLEELSMLKKLISENHFGFIYHMNCNFILRRGIPGWGYFTNISMQGGGALIDLGVHIIDLILNILNYPDLEFCMANTYDYIGKMGGTGTRGNWDGGTFTVEDACFAQLSFNNGCSVSLQTAFALHNERERNMNIELFGSLAGAQLLPFTIYKDHFGELITEKPLMEQINIKEKSIHNFINASRGVTSKICTAQEGEKVQKVIDNIYSSVQRNKE